MWWIPRLNLLNLTSIWPKAQTLGRCAETVATNATKNKNIVLSMLCLQLDLLFYKAYSILISGDQINCITSSKAENSSRNRVWADPLRPSAPYFGARPFLSSGKSINNHIDIHWSVCTYQCNTLCQSFQEECNIGPGSICLHYSDSLSQLVYISTKLAKSTTL